MDRGVEFFRRIESFQTESNLVIDSAEILILRIGVLVFYVNIILNS